MHRHLEQLARTCHLSSSRHSGTRNFLPSALLHIPDGTDLLIKKTRHLLQTLSLSACSMGWFVERTRFGQGFDRQLVSLNLSPVPSVCRIMVGTCTRTVAMALDHGFQQCLFAVFGNIFVAIFVWQEYSPRLREVEGQQEPPCKCIQGSLLASRAPVVETCRSRTVLFCTVHFVPACPGVTNNTTDTPTGVSSHTHTLKQTKAMFGQNTSGCSGTSVWRSCPAAAALSSAC